jgi:hypothetical protein
MLTSNAATNNVRVAHHCCAEYAIPLEHRHVSQQGMSPVHTSSTHPHTTLRNALLLSSQYTHLHTTRTEWGPLTRVTHHPLNQPTSLCWAHCQTERKRKGATCLLEGDHTIQEGSKAPAAAPPGARCHAERQQTAHQHAQGKCSWCPNGTPLTAHSHSTRHSQRTPHTPTCKPLQHKGRAPSCPTAAHIAASQTVQLTLNIPRVHEAQAQPAANLAPSRLDTRCFIISCAAFRNTAPIQAAAGAAVIF